MSLVLPVPRDDRGRILKGHSLNPGGRPRGSFSERVRDATRQGEELVELALAFLRGEVKGQTARDRMDALKFLSDRGWGKAEASITSTSITADVTADLSPEAREYAREQIAAVRAEVAKLDRETLRKIADMPTEPEAPARA